VLRNDLVSVNADYSRSRADSRIDDVRNAPSRKNRAKIDPNFSRAMAGFIKPPCKEKEARKREMSRTKRAWEELSDARY